MSYGETGDDLDRSALEGAGDKEQLKARRVL